MKTQARVTVHQPPCATVARVEGDLDLVTLPQVERELRAVAAEARRLFAVDVSGVTYLNSAAISLLYSLAEDLRTRHHQLRLVMAADAPLRVLLRRLRFDTVVPVHDTVDEAIAEAALDSPGPDDATTCGQLSRH